MTKSKREDFPLSVYETDAPGTISGETLTEKERQGYCNTFLNVSETLEKNSNEQFPFTPDELVERFKLVYLRMFISERFNEYLADDFIFKAPVVGPLKKAEFISSFCSFRLREAFSSSGSGMHGIYVDPFQPNRVWCTVIFEGEHTGKLLSRYDATGIWVRAGPQALSLTFDHEGLVTKLTTGYVYDRDIGNCGGMGALFGILWAIGKPFPIPEARPYSPSWQFRLFTWFGRFMLPKPTQITDGSEKTGDGNKQD